MSTPLQPFVKSFSVTPPCLPIGILAENGSTKSLLISLLMDEQYYNPSTTDSYFEESIKLTQPTEFVVCGEIIEIEDERLAKVFSTLPKLRQEVLVLYFFLRYTDRKIGEVYGRSRTTVNYWKLAALKQLRKEWERLEHEERKADTF